MEIRHYENGVVTSVERLYNSTNGNPRFEISYTCQSGAEHVRVTSSDISDAYEVGNPGFRVGDTVRFGITHAGRIARLLTHEPIEVAP